MKSMDDHDERVGNLALRVVVILAVWWLHYTQNVS